MFAEQFSQRHPDRTTIRHRAGNFRIAEPQLPHRPNLAFANREKILDSLETQTASDVPCRETLGFPDRAGLAGMVGGFLSRERARGESQPAPKTAKHAHALDTMMETLWRAFPAALRAGFPFDSLPRTAPREHLPARPA